MEYKEALNKVMALCSHQEYTTKDIHGKLSKWNLAPAEINKIIEELSKHQFVNDERYASAFTRDKLRLNQWGRIKIRYMLSGKGISHNIIDEVLEGIDEDQYREILSEILQKKAEAFKNETNAWTRKQKLMRFAASRGFEQDIVRNVLDELKI